MRLFAISDLHLRYAETRRALEEMPDHGDDWLIVAGDVGETDEHLRLAWKELGRRFARLLWVPGNHELWTVPEGSLRGDERYRHFVEICREHGVLTPEDPWVRWPGPGAAATIALLFTLYDYSFRPDDVPAERAIAWAREERVLAADERLLHPEPFAGPAEWCAERCRLAEERLVAAAAEGPLVLANHWPLRRDLLTLRRIPRFSIWCGTRRTEDWHSRFGAVALVYGHLHVRRTSFRDGVRCEEVSLGYPRDRDVARGIEPYLRQILPEPEDVGEGFRW